MNKKEKQTRANARWLFRLLDEGYRQQMSDCLMKVRLHEFEAKQPLKVTQRKAIWSRLQAEAAKSSASESNPSGNLTAAEKSRLRWERKQAALKGQDQEEEVARQML